MFIRKPRVLLVATLSGTATELLAQALHEVGFELAAIFPKDRPLKCLDLVSRVYATGALQFRRFLEKAALEFAPDLVVPGDYAATRHLHDLHAEHFRGSGKASARVTRLIENSLGNPNYYELIAKQSHLIHFARRFGLPAPEAAEFTDEAGLQAFLRQARFPLLLKLDGKRSERVHDEGEGIEAHRRLTRSWDWAGKMTGDIASVRALRQPARRAVFAQEYVDGVAASRAVACREGRVLAGITVETPDRLRDSRPASPVRFIENVGLNETVAFIVGKLGLSGFHGFDFILRRGTGQALLTGVDPYATAICPLVSDREVDLPDALYAAQLGAADRNREVVDDRLVGFPLSGWSRPAADAPIDETDGAVSAFRPL